MYHVHHASICANVVIGVLVVLCELHETRVVVVDAVVGLTLGLIAHDVVVVFVVAILQRIFYIWKYTLYCFFTCCAWSGGLQSLVLHGMVVLEPLPRRSALCTFRRALLCSISRDRALDCSGSSSSRHHPSHVISQSTDAIVVWHSPLRPLGCSPAEARCDSPQLSPLRFAICLVVSGHFSTQTCSN